MFRALLAIFLVFSLPSLASAEAQAGAPTAAQFESLLKDAEALQTENEDLRKRVKSQQGPLWDKYVEAKQREYDFQIEIMAINSRNFLQQYYASYAILVLVVCVVLSGLWFAYIQLRAGLAPFAAAVKGAASSGDAADPAARPVGIGAATTIDASLQKITVTSSVVGVIVLVISLAFLYIYTREIYRVRILDPYRPKVVDPDTTPSQGQAQKPNAPKTSD